jgi:tRNA (guanine-N7-)-methyltransferase
MPPGVRTTRRRGRTSAAKLAALRDLGPRWMLPADGPWDGSALRAGFGADGPLLVDVGVGDGRATRAWGAEHPDARVLAIELHRPGIARLLADLDATGPANVRVVEADALAVLDALPRGEVHAIRLLFPDPWPKRRHVKRRLVDRAFAALAAELLAPGAVLHVATDWEAYAEHVRTTLAGEARLAPVPDAGRPPRPTTTYEARGQRAGRAITDLLYRREDRS